LAAVAVAPLRRLRRISYPELSGMSRVVLKLGGSVAADTAADALALAGAGHELCVVHGAGPQISAEMQRRGLDVHFVGGRRVTSAAGLEVVREALAAVNAELCAAIGPSAVGLMGDEIGLRAVQIPELGLVGEAIPSAPCPVLDALAAGRIPVVAPLAVGPLNVNADEAAAALAVGIAADRILFATDVPGLLLDGAVAAAVAVDEADRLLGAGALEGGIVPKLNAAVRAARLGVRAEIGATSVIA
jgi:acetylglutamate kinase